MKLTNTEFNKFVNEVCSQIKCSEVHSEIKNELISHLEEIQEEYLSQGATCDEATKQAIAHMGDSEKIGFDLNKVYQKRPEYKTLIIASIFVLLGLFIQFIISKNAPSNMSHYSSLKNISFVFIGTISAVTLYIFDYRKLEKYSIHLFILANLLHIILLIFGRAVNGVLMVSILGGGINVAFITTVLYIISLSGLIPKLYSSSNWIIKIIAIYTLCSFMLLTTRSFAWLFIFLITSLFLLFYVGIPKKHLIPFCSIVPPLGLYFFILREPYRFQRLMIFRNFNKDLNGAGYLNYQIHKLLNSSNFWGNGVSKEILKKVPLLNQDLIYCYIIYTFGWFGACVILILVIILLVNLFKTSKFIKNNYGRTLFLSISALYAVEFLYPILMNLNLAPLTGIPMPFISYGGTSTVVNMALVGLICSIYGRKNLSKSLLKTALE